jgi:hypothetical protein
MFSQQSKEIDFGLLCHNSLFCKTFRRVFATLNNDLLSPKSLRYSLKLFSLCLSSRPQPQNRRSFFHVRRKSVQLVLVLLTSSLSNRSKASSGFAKSFSFFTFDCRSSRARSRQYSSKVSRRAETDGRRTYRGSDTKRGRTLSHGCSGFISFSRRRVWHDGHISLQQVRYKQRAYLE